MRRSAPGTAHAGAPDPCASVARIRAGDAAAFDEICGAHWVPLCQFAYAYVHEESAAKDAVADVFADLWARRGQWVVRTTVEAYLYAAVRNRACTLRRNAERRARHHAVLARDAASVPRGPAVRGAHDLVEERERHQLLEQALGAVPDRYRLVLVLRWQQQLGWVEIAEALGVSPAAATMLHTRALKCLRERLPEYFE